ncbi:MAG: hypothetical protein ACC619_00520 [Paracoccaceae bacterium]
MTVYIRMIIGFFGLAVLAGCLGPAEPKWASDADVARATYVDDGPPTITLFTVINNKTGFGGHAGLMISGSQRILFDPAGTWYHPQLPERNDVHFGMSDAVVDYYVDYHSRVTWRTVIQEVVVTPEIAELVMQRAMDYGAAAKGYCARSITAILEGVPGFESINRTWWPTRLSAEFAKLPGATMDVVYDNDADDNSGIILAPPIVFQSGT